MNSEEKTLLVRSLELATGITAVVTVVVLSSVAGAGAYLAFQPSSLAAQAVAATSGGAGSSIVSSCQQEIATAAARGTPDTETTVTDPSGLTLNDNCVAAILSPSAATLGPNNPGSYQCVGKSATVNVAATGAVTETAVPNASVPAGICSTVACGAPGATGQSSCFTASKLTSINGTTIQNTLSESQAVVTPDSGISNFTLNADGSIANTTGNTSAALESSAGDQGLAGNTVSLQQTAGTQAAAPSVDSTSIGETQAVAAQPTEVVTPPAEPPATPTTAPTQTTTVTPDTGTSAANPVSNAAEPSVTSAPTTETTAATDGPTSANTTTDLNGPQPTEPTLNANTQAQSIPNSTSASNPSLGTSQGITANSETFLDKVGDVGNSLINDVRSWMGLSPLGTPEPVGPTVDSLGVRG